jgi:hypothetical protein
MSRYPHTKKTPDELRGYAEKQLDAVDATVFSGDAYACWSRKGRDRFRYYLDRWCRETYGVDVPALTTAIRTNNKVELQRLIDCETEKERS